MADRPDAPVFVDFDHTLVQTNATEAFLASARPRRLAAALLWFIDLVKPWRVLPAEGRREFAWRDPIRIRTLLFFCPGMLRRWQSQGAAELARRIDPDLAAKLAGRRNIVVTHGFAPVVEPTLAAAGLTPQAGWTLVATPLRGAAAVRDRGKRAALAARPDLPDPASAILVTDDPIADADLIRAVAIPVAWPEAPPLRPAFDDFFLPLRYLLRVKRRGQRHMRTVVLGEDAAVLLIACAFANPAFWALIPAAILLVLAFTAVYEIGYAENDRIGRLVERKPIIPDGWDIWSSDTIARWNWIAAGLLSAPALALLALSGAGTGPAVFAGLPTILSLGLGWLSLLIVQRSVFAGFNRLRPGWRPIPFVALQGLKCLGVVAALGLATTPVGLILMVAHIASRTLPYVVYRCGGPRWVTPDQAIRLGLFAAGAAAVAAVAGPEALGPIWAVLLAALWCLAKARRELLQAVGLEPKPVGPGR